MNREFQLTFITGVMGSGKSERLLEMMKEVKGWKRYLVLKPVTDTRDGDKVRTRAHEETHNAVLVDESNEQMVGLVFAGVEHYDVVFVDESQFFSESFVQRLSDYCTTYDIHLVVSGLLRDFKGEYFPSSYWITEHIQSDEDMTFYKGHCMGCEEKEAVIDVLMDENGHIIREGDSVFIQRTDEDILTYEQLCAVCLKNYE